MAEEDEDETSSGEEEPRPRRREWKRKQDFAEEGSVATERTTSTLGPSQKESRYDTMCGLAWKTVAFCSLVACIVLSIIVVVLYVEGGRVARTFTKKKTALDDMRGNYTQVEHAIAKEISKTQCSRYEDTFHNWLQSFCRIVNCTSELCHKLWTPYGGHCYFFSKNILGWEESRQACISHGSELLVIRSEEEQQFVAEYNTSRVYWIGIKDNPLESAWTWVDGTALQDDLTFWDKDYPDSYFDYDLEAFKNCVYLRAGAWGNAVCGKPHYWICKRRSEKPPLRL